jgi:hypothetical protein
MLVWRYLDGDGRETGSSEAFPDREAAESWLRESWEDLVEDGVEAVALRDEAESELYRMKLASPEG